MKKIRLLIAILVFCLLFPTSCGNNQRVTESVADYFPMAADTYYEYAGDGLEGANMQAFVTYIGNGKAQRRVSTVDTISVTEVLELSDNAVKLVYVDPDRYRLEDLTKEKPNLDYVLIQAPLKINATWETKDMNGNTIKCQITNMSADVTVPYGTFKAIEVSSEYSNGYSQKDYYVKDVGLVKTIYTIKTWIAGDEKNATETSVSSSLVSVNSDHAIEYPVALLYPDKVGNRIYELEGRVVLRTNTDGLKFIAKLLNAHPDDEDLINLIDDDVSIEKIAVDSNAFILSVDFSKNFYNRKMDYERESATLQCIVNTLGRLYKVYQVELTVGGQNYKSGNITLNTGDYIEVEYQ